MTDENIIKIMDKRKNYFFLNFPDEINNTIDLTTYLDFEKC